VQQLAHRQAAPFIGGYDDFARAKPVAQFHQGIRPGRRPVDRFRSSGDIDERYWKKMLVSSGFNESGNPSRLRSVTQYEDAPLQQTAPKVTENVPRVTDTQTSQISVAFSGKWLKSVS